MAPALGGGVLGRGPGATDAHWLPAPVSGLPGKLSYRLLELSVLWIPGGHVKMEIGFTSSGVGPSWRS